MESESGTTAGKESMRPQSGDLEQRCHWLPPRSRDLPPKFSLAASSLPALVHPNLPFAGTTCRAGAAYSRDSDRKLALRRRRRRRRWIMTLAGFMRGGGGSTNMRLSRRHCWLASRVAQQQQQQTIQQQALQFASCCCCCCCWWTTEAGEGGGCTQGSITQPPFACSTLFPAR